MQDGEIEGINGFNNNPRGERNREGLYSLQRVQKINRNYDQAGTMALSPKNFKG